MTAGRGAAARDRDPAEKPPGRAQRRGRPADSVDKVYEILKDLAVNYRFRPGERVNEVELAARLGVSRTPVREAMNRLARDGFMTFVPNKGFFCRDLTPEGVRDLYELRAAIERSAFKLATQRASDEEIEEAARIWHSRCAPASEADWTEVAAADEAFHVAIVRLSRNEQMILALEGVNSLIRFFRRIDLETPRRRNGTYPEHAAIIEALRARDANKGCELMESHITFSSDHAVEVAREGLARIFFNRDQ